MRNFLGFLFGCRHKHVGWPIRNRQTCLDCGKNWPHHGFGGLPAPRLTQPGKPRELDGSWEGFESITKLMARERRVGIARVK